MVRRIILLAGLLVFLATHPALAGLAKVAFGYEEAGARVELEGWLYTPDEAGPHPALVLMHGCSGIESAHHAWARRLAEAGTVALVVDGFTTRGIRDVCTAATFYRISYRQRMADAYAGADYLRAQPAVDPDRIGLIGWSHGGIIALRLAADTLAAPFRAVVALYPYCGESIGDVTRPLLILIGDADEWTPAPLCAGFTRLQNLGRTVVELVIYPGATHSFDEAAVGTGIVYLGHPLRYDPAATEDAASRIAAFFEREMP